MHEGRLERNEDRTMLRLAADVDADEHDHNDYHHHLDLHVLRKQKA